MTAKLERPARQCLEDRRSAPCNSLVFFVLSQLLFCVWHFKWPMPIPHNYYIYSLYFDTLGFRGISLWSVSKWLEWSKKGAVEGGAKIKAVSAVSMIQPSQWSNPDFLSYELSTWSGYTAMKNDQSHELCTQHAGLFHDSCFPSPPAQWHAFYLIRLALVMLEKRSNQEAVTTADQVGSAQWVSNEQWSSGKISFWCNNNL